MTRTLEELCAGALEREATTPAVEFGERTIDWGAMRHVAERVGALIDASGASRHTPIAFVPRNRPSAMAALLGLIARGHSVRMVYAFQSGAALGREVERLAPAVIVAAEEDYSEELLQVLRNQGTAAIALNEMDANAVAGFARSTRPGASNEPAPRQIELLTSGTTGPPKPFAVIDADGFMFHRGRADGAIMRGGFKLLPERIERALMLHESVAAAGVLGLRDPRLGQVPAAAIQLKPDVGPPAIEELETHLRGHVYATHIPVTWRFVDELPRTPSLKVDRIALQALFERGRFT